MSKEIEGISIDTSVFQAHGFRLDAGELGVLQHQLPPWMTLYLPSAVQNEVLGHQEKEALEALRHLRSSLQQVHRHTGLDVKSIDTAIQKLGLDAAAPAAFRQRLDTFVKRFHGKVTEIGGEKTLREIFDRYFRAAPPFGQSKDKKHEFPDAASLLALEKVAQELKTKLILVSGDRGWQDFADKSEHLYCVKDLEDLSALYESDSKVAEAVEERVVQQLTAPNSPLLGAIESALETEVPNLSWVAEAHTGHCSGIDPEVVSADLVSFEANAETLRLWMSEGNDKICVVEVDLRVACDFKVSAEFSQWDSVDNESMSMGTGTAEFEAEVAIPVFVTLSGDLLKGDPKSWGVKVEVSQGHFWIDAGEMDPDWLHERDPGDD
jgi:hypothetical protein